MARNGTCKQWAQLARDAKPHKVVNLQLFQGMTNKTKFDRVSMLPAECVEIELAPWRIGRDSAAWLPLDAIFMELPSEPDREIELFIDGDAADVERALTASETSFFFRFTQAVASDGTKALELMVPGVGEVLLPPANQMNDQTGAYRVGRRTYESHACQVAPDGLALREIEQGMCFNVLEFKRMQNPNDTWCNINRSQVFLPALVMARHVEVDLSRVASHVVVFAPDGFSGMWYRTRIGLSPSTGLCRLDATRVVETTRFSIRPLPHREFMEIRSLYRGARPLRRRGACIAA